MKLVKVFKENKQFTLFSILALVVVGVAVFAPQIAPYDPLDAVMLESFRRQVLHIPLEQISWDVTCYHELFSEQELL